MNTLDQAKQLQDRTKKFAIRVIKAFARLPKEEATRIIGRQFLRAGTSLAANYRAACRARSTADFISKISVVAEETDGLEKVGRDFRLVDFGSPDLPATSTVSRANGSDRRVDVSTR